MPTEQRQADISQAQQLFLLGEQNMNQGRPLQAFRLWLRSLALNSHHHNSQKALSRFVGDLQWAKQRSLTMRQSISNSETLFGWEPGLYIDWRVWISWCETLDQHWVDSRQQFETADRNGQVYQMKTILVALSSWEDAMIQQGALTAPLLERDLWLERICRRQQQVALLEQVQAYRGDGHVELNLLDRALELFPREENFVRQYERMHTLWQNRLLQDLSHALRSDHESASHRWSALLIANSKERGLSEQVAWVEKLLQKRFMEEARQHEMQNRPGHAYLAYLQADKFGSLRATQALERIRSKLHRRQLVVLSQHLPSGAKLQLQPRATVYSEERSVEDSVRAGLWRRQSDVLVQNPVFTSESNWATVLSQLATDISARARLSRPLERIHLAARQSMLIRESRSTRFRLRDTKPTISRAKWGQERLPSRERMLKARLTQTVELNWYDGRRELRSLKVNSVLQDFSAEENRQLGLAADLDALPAQLDSRILLEQRVKASLLGLQRSLEKKEAETLLKQAAIDLESGDRVLAIEDLVYLWIVSDQEPVAANARRLLAEFGPATAELF